jgi:hypothetical protein
MAKINFFGFGFLLLKVGGGAQKKLPWPCFELLNFVLGILGMAESKFFSLGLLFSMSKVGD